MKKVKSVDFLQNPLRKKEYLITEEDHETDSSVKDLGIVNSATDRDTVIKWRANAVIQKLTIAMNQMTNRILEQQYELRSLRKHSEQLRKNLLGKIVNRQNVINELQILSAHALDTFHKVCEKSVKNLEDLYNERLQILQKQLKQQIKLRKNVQKKIIQIQQQRAETKQTLNKMMKIKFDSDQRIQRCMKNIDNTGEKLRISITKNRDYWQKKMFQAEQYYRQIKKMLHCQIQDEKKQRQVNKQHILEQFEKILLQKGFKM